MPKGINTIIPSTKLRDRYGLLGGFSPKLDETIVPVVLLDDLSSPAAAGSQRIMSGFGQLGPTVGNFSHVQLFNPANSGVLLELLVADVFIGATQAVRLRLHDIALAAEAPDTGWLDARLEGAGAGEVRVEDAVAVLGAAVGSYRATANENLPVPKPVILLPGTGALFAPQNNNVVVGASFLWLERTLEPGEG